MILKVENKQAVIFQKYLLEILNPFFRAIGGRGVIGVYAREGVYTHWGGGQGPKKKANSRSHIGPVYVTCYIGRPNLALSPKRIYILIIILQFHNPKSPLLACSRSWLALGSIWSSKVVSRKYWKSKIFKVKIPNTFQNFISTYINVLKSMQALCSCCFCWAFLVAGCPLELFEIF